MYNGVGLTSVRGTATSGHIQTNRSHVRASDVRRKTQVNAHQSSTDAHPRHSQKNLNTKQKSSSILSKQDSDRLKKRHIEQQLLELRERLEDGRILSAEEIDLRVQRERDRLIQLLNKEEEHQQEEEKRTKLAEEQNTQDQQNTTLPVTASNRSQPTYYRDQRLGLSLGSGRAREIKTNSHVREVLKERENEKMRGAFGIPRGLEGTS